MGFSIRYSIPMNGPGCQESVKTKLNTVDKIENISIDLKNQEAVITGEAPPSSIVKAMQEIGRDAFVRGSGLPNSAAVAILETNAGQVKGLARLIEVSKGTTLFDISIDREFGNTAISVFSFGDISNPPKTLGSRIFDVTSMPNTGEGLGSINAWATHKVPLHDLIGRSIHTGSGLTGIVARSAGLWENDKSVCTCSGNNAWEERKVFREKTNGAL